MMESDRRSTSEPDFCTIFLLRMPKASRNSYSVSRTNPTQRPSAVEILSSRPDDWKPKKDPKSLDDVMSLCKYEIQFVLDSTKGLQEELSRTRLYTAMNLIKFPEKEEKLMKQMWKMEKWNQSKIINDVGTQGTN
jgi:hypothetical protein